MKLLALGVVLALLGGCAVRICDGRLTPINASPPAKHDRAHSGNHTP